MYTLSQYLLNKRIIQDFTTTEASTINAFLLDELSGRWTAKVLDQWLNELQYLEA